MKTYLLTLTGLLGVFLLNAQNPISPPGVYFADPSAKVWDDGHLYLYGSLDESCDYYCSYRHHVMETSDLKSWIIHEDKFASRGEGDEVPYNDELLYAPDCGFHNGRYYLYFCQPDPVNAEGVAFSDNPEGPFKNGQPINLGGHNQIDPSVFIDDDGQAYYMWGQFTLKMAKMKPNMTALDLSTLKDNVLTEEEHFFHEGAYMIKRNGIYYLVFADISREDKPTCIGYATSQSPMGPYEYQGVIVDNNGCNPGNWNNHGSIIEYQDQWYVFYHRSTHGCKMMRKACVEPITFNPDGSIPEVRMTSQGAGAPLDAFQKIEAEWACQLMGNVRVQAFSENEEELAQIHNDDHAIIKYVDFGDGVNEVVLRVAPGKDGGRIVLSSDTPWNKKFAFIDIKGSDQPGEYQTLRFDVDQVEGVHALYLEFFGDGDDMLSLDWIRFE
ncbi:MAG: family 43 glycosylhydrolase [Mariniphaga sp.]